MSDLRPCLPDDSERQIVFFIGGPFEPPGLFQVLVLVVPVNIRPDVRSAHWGYVGGVGGTETTGQTPPPPSRTD